jgi:hypothetical protein
MQNAYSIMFIKPEGKRPFGRSWHGMANDIKTDVKGNKV